MTSAAESTTGGRILVGYDGSPNSERAFDIALALAAAQGRSIRLVSAYTVPFAYIDPHNKGQVESQETFRRTIEYRITDSAEELQARAKDAGVDVELVIEEGDAAGVLSRLSSDSDLSVVGKRGRNAFTSRFTGSVSSSFASHAHCPTLVVPETWTQEQPLVAAAVPPAEPAQVAPARAEEQQADFSGALHGAPPTTGQQVDPTSRDYDFSESIVAAIDPGDESAPVAALAARWAARLNRRLVLVSAVALDSDSSGWMMGSVNRTTGLSTRARTVAVDHLTRAAAQLEQENPGLQVQWRFFDGAPVEVLSEASRTAALVVVGTRGRGGFTGLLLGSVSRGVLNHAESPVMVVPVKGR